MVSYYAANGDANSVLSACLEAVLVGTGLLRLRSAAIVRNIMNARAVCPDEWLESWRKGGGITLAETSFDLVNNHD